MHKEKRLLDGFHLAHTDNHHDGSDNEDELENEPENEGDNRNGREDTDDTAHEEEDTGDLHVACTFHIADKSESILDLEAAQQHQNAESNLPERGHDQCAVILNDDTDDQHGMLPLPDNRDQYRRDEIS